MILELNTSFELTKNKKGITISSGQIGLRIFYLLIKKVMLSQEVIGDYEK